MIYCGSIKLQPPPDHEQRRRSAGLVTARLYMSGGSLGWYKCVTEANIALPEMAQIALDMRAACRLPIVLDGGGGWGDPVHIGLGQARWRSAQRREKRLFVMHITDIG